MAPRNDFLSDSSSRPDARAVVWRLRTRVLELGPLPRVMGIVNITPDSFSDGGRFLEPSAAIDHALRLADEGADLLDLGGQSTRPGATIVGADEELRRIMPVVARLCEQTDVPISIDTFHARVAQEALAAGAEVINDITGMTDPEMVQVAVESRAGVCVMHMQGTPETMQDNPTYANVVAEVRDYLAGRSDALMDAGVEASRICLDPGIGFGKSTEHNLALLAGIGSFHSLGCPLLVGPSRKTFIGRVLGDMDADRTAGTLAVVLALAQAGVQIVRVHDVASVRQALILSKMCQP